MNPNDPRTRAAVRAISEQAAHLGDKSMVRICKAALAGDSVALQVCADVIADPSLLVGQEVRS